MFLLAFDTATPSCSVAVTEGTSEHGRVLASLTLGGLTHSRRLLASIHQLMNDVGISWNGLDGIVVGIGPGSFTGLRIGIAAAHGLAFAAQLPLLGISTLDVLAAGVPNPCRAERVCAVLDARKKEVYACFYHPVDTGVEAVGEPLVVPPARLVEETGGEILLVGDGAQLYRQLLDDAFRGRAHFAPARYNLPSAEVLGLLGGAQLKGGAVSPTTEVLPRYVRKSDAELNLARKREGTL